MRGTVYSLAFTFFDLLEQWANTCAFVVTKAFASHVAEVGSHIKLTGVTIIIIIWHYNPLWALAFSAKSLQVLLSLAVSFQFLTFSFFRSSITSSCHHFLGLPTGYFQ